MCLAYHIFEGRWMESQLGLQERGAWGQKCSICSVTVRISEKWTNGICIIYQIMQRNAMQQAWSKTHAASDFWVSESMYLTATMIICLGLAWPIPTCTYVHHLGYSKQAVRSRSGVPRPSVPRLPPSRLLCGPWFSTSPLFPRNSEPKNGWLKSTSSRWCTRRS